MKSRGDPTDPISSYGRQQRWWQSRRIASPGRRDTPYGTGAAPQYDSTVHARGWYSYTTTVGSASILVRVLSSR